MSFENKKSRDRALGSIDSVAPQSSVTQVFPSCCTVPLGVWLCPWTGLLMVSMAAAASGVPPREDIAQRKEAVFSLCFFLEREPFLESPSRILPASNQLGLGHMPISKQSLEGDCGHVAGGMGGGGCRSPGGHSWFLCVSALFLVADTVHVSSVL